MKLSRAIFLGLLALVILRFATRYPDLPDTLASHFGADGRPNGWMRRDVFAWFGLIPLGAALVVTFLGPLLVKHLPPSLVNMPNKDYWLAPERKAETITAFSSHMDWFGVALLAFLAFVYELVYQANASPDVRLAEGPFLAGLVAFFAFTIVWLVAFYRRFRKPALENMP